MTPKEQKAELRKILLAKRDDLALNYKALLDNAVVSKLEELIEQRQPKVIHTYLPFGSEIDIYPLIQSLLDRNFAVICPKSLPKRELQNLVLHSLSELEEGRFGTRHPANSSEYTGEIDMYIVPGIGFDNRSYRLGYGSGYYDKYFSSHPSGYKVGICYPFQVINNFPEEPHDVKLDQVIY